MADSRLYGIMARFDTADALTRASRAAVEAGYRELDAFAPFPVPGLDQALGLRRSRLTIFALVAGVVAGAGAFALQWYSAVVDYPFVVGGKPLNSWPAFLPVTFETGILAAVVTALVGMLAGNGLPRPYHPVFNHAGFGRASDDGFFLVIPVAPQGGADTGSITGFLERQGALDITEVPS
ncbi:MAG: DUF3341 domain-containing protein [Marinobacter sp.]